MIELPEWIVKYWIEWLFGLIIAGLGFVIKSLHKKLKDEKEQRENENKALRDGMKSLLRRQILIDCEKAQTLGFCDSTTKGTIQSMYDAYHALGGNDVVSAAVHQVISDLPLTSNERHERRMA